MLVSYFFSTAGSGVPERGYFSAGVRVEFGPVSLSKECAA